MPDARGVLLGLFGEDPHRVVDGDDPDEALLVVDDGEADHAVVADEPRRDLLVLVHVDAHGPRTEVDDPLVAFGGDELPQGDDADETPPRTEDRHHVDRLDVGPRVAQGPQGLPHGRRLRDRRDLRRHPTACRLPREPEDRLRHLPLAGVQPRQQGDDEGGGQLVEEARTVVGVEVGDEPTHRLRTQVRDELTGGGGVEALEDVEGRLLVEEAEHDGTPRGRQPTERAADLGDAERGQRRRELRRVALGEDTGLFGRHGAHGRIDLPGDRPPRRPQR